MSSLRGRRVVFVLNWADLGGAEQSALALAEHLRSVEDAYVEVVALTARDGVARTRFTEGKIPWLGDDLAWRGGKAAKARTLAVLAHRLRRERPDILMPYCTPPNVLCGLVWKLTGASLCVWNQRDVNPSRHFGPGVIRRALDATPLILACSDGARDFVVNDWGARPGRSHVVLDGIEPRVPRADRASWRSRLGVQDDRVVVVMVGHLHAFKDHDTLLRAWRLVQARWDSGPRPLLVIAGRSAGKEAVLKALAFDFSLDGTVTFLDEVDDVGGLLQGVDIGVLSSRAESRPRAILEYMASGLPVAGTNIQGIRDLVGPMSVRFLAPPGAAEQLADVLTELAVDADLRRAAGEANARLFRSLPTPVEGRRRAVALLEGALAR